MRWLAALLLLVLVVILIARRLPREARARSAPPPPPEDDPMPPVRLTGDEIDLHTVAPRDVIEIVDEFVSDARSRGLRRVKIVHGKGTGVLRQRVRERLGRHPGVLGWHDAESPGSGWGATVVHLAPGDPPLADPGRSDLVS